MEALKKFGKFILTLPFLLALLLFWSVAAAASKIQADKSRELRQSITRIEHAVSQIELSIRTHDEYAEPFNRIVHSYTTPAAFRFRINRLLKDIVRQFSVSGATQYTLDRRYPLRGDPYAQGNADAASTTLPLHITEATIDLELQSQAHIFSVLQELVSANDRLAAIDFCVIKEPGANPYENTELVYFQLGCAMKFFEIESPQMLKEAVHTNHG